MATDEGVFACLENNFPFLVPLPSGVTVTDRVRFTQAGSTLYMWRGFDADPLRCTDLLVGFEDVPDPPAGSGLQRIPRGIRAVVVGNRMWVQAADDQVWPSDVLDYEAFDLANVQTIQSNPGDVLQTIVQFGSGIAASIICLKRRSVHRLVNVSGDLGDLILLTVTNRFGCVAPESAADWGSDLAWLADEGVASLSLTEFGELQPTVRSGREPQPMLSDAIQPLIERINWQYAENAWGAFWNGNYYLAVPLDDAESFRQELAMGQFVGRGGATAVVPGLLEVGATYRYIRGESGVSLTNGAQVFTDQHDFTATSEDVTFTLFGAGSICNDSLMRVFKGVNTAVLVFSTRNAAWAGYDTTPGLEVKQFFTAKTRSRLRLFFISQDGWVPMYEEDFEDAIAVPYVDVTVGALPANGDTIQVNGGQLVTADDTLVLNTGTAWGTDNLNLAQANFYRVIDDPSNMGYNQQNGWAAYFTTPFRVDSDTVRFYSTNGLVPTITITGDWATVLKVNTQPIEWTLVTRAYRLTQETRPGLLAAMIAQLQTWAPTYTVSSLPEGVEEQQVLVDAKTRSRTKYDRPFNKPDWVQTNINDDFHTPFRQDYSVVFTSDTMELTLESNGVTVDKHQEITHPIRGRGRGRTVQATILNETGRVRLLAMQSEGIRRDRGYGIKT